jgi:hypothetical protein
MKVGERRANHHGVLGENLDQGSHLRHALRIAHHPGYRSSGTCSSTDSRHRKHHGEKRDFHLGSLHSFDT